MSNRKTDFRTVLKSHGIQFTPQRETIWKFYESSQKGVTIADAIDELRCNGIGQATVYRTTFKFFEIGLLHRIQMPDGMAFFAAVKSEHSHPLICRRCHRIVEFSTCDLSVLEKLLSVQTGYDIDGHQLEIYGICPSCKQSLAQPV